MINKKNSKFWKKFILILSAVAIVSSATVGYIFFDMDHKVQNPSAWERYTPDSQRFHIQFPKAPEEKSEALEIENTKIEYQHLSSAVKESEYAVSYIDFPGKWKFFLGTSKLLNKVFDYLQSPSGEIIEQEFVTHKGYPSLKYVVKEGDKLVSGMLVIVGNTLYRITVDYPNSLKEKIDPEAFFDSFQVT